MTLFLYSIKSGTKSIRLHYIGTASIQYTIYKLFMSCDNSILLTPNFIKILHNLGIDHRKLSCDFDNFHIKFCCSIAMKLCLLKWTLFQIFQLLVCVCMITITFCAFFMQLIQIKVYMTILLVI